MPPPLRFNWRNFYYTDGSATTIQGRGASISAAVFKPADTMAGLAGVHTTNCTVTGGPLLGSGDKDLPNINTINRAELAGIRAAYMMADPSPDDEVHIATDSQTSMYQIHKMVTHPQDMREHRHHSLLTDIVHRLHESEASLHLWKVTSHAGIYGNEMADYMAVGVATQQQEPMVVEAELQSISRHTCFWPWSIEEVVTTNATTREHTPIAIANLAETLKTVAKRDCTLGEAKTSSVYYQAWAQQDRHIKHKNSHLFMTSSTVQHRRRKLILQYRWGLLPTNKLLHRYKKCNSDMRPALRTAGWWPPRNERMSVPDGGGHQTPQ